MFHNFLNYMPLLDSFLYGDIVFTNGYSLILIDLTFVIPNSLACCSLDFFFHYKYFAMLKIKVWLCKD